MKLPELKTVRQLRGMTQPDLAEASGVSMRTIVNEEHGGEARPGTARKLAEALGVSIPVLAGVEPFPTTRRGGLSEPTAVLLEDMYVASDDARRRALLAATKEERESYVASIERAMLDVLGSMHEEGDWADVANDVSKPEGERRVAREQLAGVRRHVGHLARLWAEATGEGEEPSQEERAGFIADHAGVA